MNKHFTDRSRTIAYQRCHRLRYWEYEHDSTGLAPVAKSLALIVGGCVHEGLAVLLQLGQEVWASGNPLNSTIEDHAVKTALESFDDFTRDSKLELDAREQHELTQAAAAVPKEAVVDFSADLYLSDEPLDPRLTAPNNASQVQEKFLETEQRALIEAMVRAYARRRLQPLLEEFEVLEVEREGEWLLGDWMGRKEFYAPPLDGGTNEVHELWWMSRPDALLRHRLTNDLHIMSFKTTGAWDHRKEKDALRDMQGLSEGVEIERRLGEWWNVLHSEKKIEKLADIPDVHIVEYLKALATPPRIAAIRYEYLLKGERWKDKGLSEKLGIDARSQNTPLLQPYKKLGITAGDDQFGWKYEFTDAGGSNRRLDYRSWKKCYIWEQMSVRQWIDMLDNGSVQPDAGDALAAQFVPPMTIYRQEDELRDWIEQVEAVEVQCVKNSELTSAATDESERRHLLNILWPQTRQACEFPGSCAFIPLCWGSEEIRKNPIGSGKFRARVPNHPVEGTKNGSR